MLYLVLPAYNEEQDIASLLTRVWEVMPQLKLDYKVLVVNDGSTDNTLGVVDSFTSSIPLEVLDHGTNKGLGQAILTGLRRANELAVDDDVVVSMDADNTHDPQLIGAMVDRLKAGKDIVIASRYEAGGKEIGLSYSRHVFSRGASLLLSFFFPIPGAKDYTCGYRAYRGAMLHRAFATYGDKLVEERGFTCMAEILIKMGKLSARVDEAPLVLRYDLKSGKSKMKKMRTIRRYMVLIARNRF